MSSASTWPHLIVPGWGGSEPAHWQSVWQRELGADRVELEDWFAPEPTRWIDALDRAIAALAARDPRPPILIAHSLGCIAIAHWQIRVARPVHAALLVAPADVEQAPCLAKLAEFAPIPRVPLRFLSTVIASDDDPCSTLARSAELALAWSSGLHVVPGGGHLNTASNLGAWPAARGILARLQAQADQPTERALRRVCP